MRHAILLGTVCVMLVTPTALAVADPAQDLTAGKAWLAQGEPVKALPLLERAAQAMPRSVDAQFALGQAYLQLGQLGKALEQFQAALRLAPKYEPAKQIVEALTGTKTTFDQQMAYAKAMRDLGQYSVATSVLRKLGYGPYTPDQRTAARLLMAESAVLTRPSTGLQAAVELLKEREGKPEADRLRVVAALALVERDETKADALEMLKTVKDLPPVWQKRADLARLLATLDDATAAAVSGKLAAALAGLPEGCPARTDTIRRLVKTILPMAQERVNRGETDAALAVVWPMLSGKPLPTADAVLKPLAVGDGWVDRTPTFSEDFVRIGDVLVSAGTCAFEAEGRDASLLGLWLAAEVYRQTPADERGRNRAIQNWLGLAATLAGMSRPAPDRKAGAVLSPADALQQACLLQLAKAAQDERTRRTVADLVIAHVSRYEKADDLLTGLGRFTLAVRPPEGVRVNVAPNTLDLLPGEGHRKLAEFIAGRYAALGVKTFNETIPRLAPGEAVGSNGYDNAALRLYAEVVRLYPPGKTAETAAGKIIERYVKAKQWKAAAETTQVFYAPRGGSADAWAQARLKLLHAQADETERLRAGQRLANDPPDLVKQALAEAGAIVAANPDKANLAAAKAMADGLAARYISLGRDDLAAAVIDALAGGKAAEHVADWALVQRAGMLERSAAKEVARLVRAFDGAGTLTLNKDHKAAIDLWGRLVKEHPKSDYAPQADKRVRAIATLYQQHKAFDVAAVVLGDFAKAHPKLPAADALRFGVVEVALAKARAAFADRPDKKTPPKALSKEYAAALDALAAFIKATPTAKQVETAETVYLDVARAYGAADAWAVARDVVARLKAAKPDTRAPERLRLIEAATYLGELDRQHGLALLTPAQVTSTIPTYDWSTVSGEVRDTIRDLVTAERNRREGRTGPSGITTPVAPPQPTEMPAVRRPGPANDEADQTLARIRQAERRQVQQIAMLEQGGQGGGQGGRQQAPQRQAVRLPAGPVLSEEAMKRQDAAADKAYAILLALVTSDALASKPIHEQARGEILWLVGFFEGQRRADRAVALIERYLTDRPTDPGRVALAYQALNDRLAWAGQRQPTEKIDQAWIDAHHTRFEAARTAIARFVKDYAKKESWAHRARLLAVMSYQQEATLAASVSAARAGGLWARSADELLALSREAPDHPEAAHFPDRLWTVGTQLARLGQRDQAVYVLSRITIRFPTHARANQAVFQIAQLYAQNLASPLKAVETYQEYLSLTGDTSSVQSQIYAIAQQLATKKRYLEALNVYGVFVDSFPKDARAPQVLLAMGQIHQTNESWDDAVKAYKRVLDEYGGSKQVPQVKLAIAECRINLSEWREARRSYDEFIRQYGGDARAALAKSRIDVLKSLDRYQTLLADKEVTRNKDDAQFQIARIVLEKLGYRAKAAAEFRKVLANHPKSHLADDAQLEIGQALLDLQRPDEARDELWKVAVNFPQSPLADNALHLIGQSYEQQAVRLAAVTLKRAQEEAFERGQRGAYGRFQYQQDVQKKIIADRRRELKQAGKGKLLELEEAANASRFNPNNDPNVMLMAREAQMTAETESALQVANRQDRINEAYRQAVGAYGRAAKDHPLGDATDESLLRMAQIFETNLKDTKAAMETYQKVVKFFPGTRVAEDAAWKVAAFYDQEGRFDEAVIAYRDFIRTYPGTKRVPDALYAMAEALEKQGRWVEAMDAYQTFRDKFASHPKAPAAKEQQMWIKAYRM